MQLLDHVSISVSDLHTARLFYDAIMTALGASKVYDRSDALGYGERCTETDTASTCLAIYLEERQINITEKRHWCFKAPSRKHVDAFFNAGIAAGGHSGGGPRLRPHYHQNYYAAFLIDPAGNRVEAVCHAALQDIGATV